MEEVLNWMVHHKKLTEILGLYSLDRFELIDLEEKFKKERLNKETTKNPASFTAFSTINTIHHTVNQKPRVLEIILKYVFPAVLLSYIVFIFFLINKLNNSFEINPNSSSVSKEVTIINPRTATIWKKEDLSDRDVKRLFSNQFQNIVYLNSTIDSLQQKVNKLNQIHTTEFLKLNTQINALQPQVNTILLHSIVLLFCFVLLFFMKNFMN